MTDQRPGAGMPTFGSASVRLLPQQDIFASLLQQVRSREQTREPANRNSTEKQSPAA